MNLQTPPEPTDIKQFIKEVRSRASSGNVSGDDIDWDSLAVWYLNKLPSYLWRHWKGKLEKEGYTWQRFLKVVKLHTNDAIMWALTEKLSWEAFVQNIVLTLKRYSKTGIRTG